MKIGEPGPLDERRGAFRVGLLLVAASHAWVALWALLAPRSFHDEFPGGGREWVAPLGPYNEHMVRDVGATFTALVVLLVIAAIVLERRLVQAALVAWLLFAIPHFAYHLTTTDEYSTSDNIGSLGGLALQVVLPLVLLALSLRGARERSPSDGPAERAAAGHPGAAR